MHRNRNKGATLSLIVSLCVVIAMLGMGVFFLIKILGGARELQHAVDSGNLNVAKQALRNPTININDVNSVAQVNFAGTVDTTNGGIDLIVYNRLVAQALLVAINAASDNSNPLGIQHAKQLISSLSDPSTGVGAVLAKKLQTDVAMDNSFNGLAALAANRMLNANSSAVGSVYAAKDVSRMSRGQASNVIFPSNLMPSEFASILPNFTSQYTTTTLAGGTTQYLAGYEPINIPGVTDANTVLIGVPLHPMQKPHLVGASDFNLNKNAIAGLSQTATSAVPPNSFMSGGMAEELKSAKILQTLSCAIVGTVTPSGQYTASIPCGYLVVANGNSTGSLTTPTTASSETSPGPIVMDQYAAGLTDSACNFGNRDIFSDVLMSNVVYVTPNGAMSENSATLQAIIDWKNNQSGAPLPDTLINAIDGPEPKQQFAEAIDPNQGYVGCTNYNSAPGDPNANSTCTTNLSKMCDVYQTNFTGGSEGAQLTNLTAIEYEKAEVIDPRPLGIYSHTSNLSTKYSGGGVCTGMKNMPLDKIPYKAAIDFGVTATISNLLGPNSTFTSCANSSANATTIYNQFKQRLYEIYPSAQDSDIAAVMSAELPMGSVKYIYFDPTTQNLVVSDVANVPKWINTNNVQPDGSTVIASSGPVDLVNTFVDMNGEQGFDNPWDCSAQTSATSEAIWTRSSGYNGTLGVLRFVQCATDDGEPWACPC